MPLRTLSACRRCQQYTKGWQHFRLLLFFFSVFFFVCLSIRTYGNLSLLLFSFLFFYFFVGYRNRNRQGHDLRDAVFGRVSNIM
ncbi:hypothetical protein V1504DRAFT_464282 [Lipomyces starkeyi]